MSTIFKYLYRGLDEIDQIGVNFHAPDRRDRPIVESGDRSITFPSTATGKFKPVAYDLIVILAAKL
ncbi:hypothetical protein AM228_12145 [Planktothricoides sp. SR001]|uniref:hypothetical protein n=1 Tax=Planktothricoides sp. SR001 TaxID=1705388 RepID=UPI0006C52B5D|nr:hypothetical protein [Planktothricoides sp. SR001]KOR36512.1 hypothetical protein AM228_12145 [Planktothricoides sp. SR001]